MKGMELEYIYEEILVHFPEYKNILYNSLLPNEEIQNFILLRQVSGKYTGQIKATEIEFQISVQDVSFIRAKNISYNIFNLFKNLTNFSLTLEGKESLFISSLKAENVPIDLGQVNFGFYQFSTIYKLLIGE